MARPMSKNHRSHALQHAREAERAAFTLRTYLRDIESEIGEETMTAACKAADLLRTITSNIFRTPTEPVKPGAAAEGE